MSQAFVYRARGERNTCPACGHADLFDLDLLPLRGRRTGFVCGCESCGLVFSNPMPTSDDLAQFYAPDGHWAERRPEAPAAANDRGKGTGAAWAREFAPIRDRLDVLAPPPGACVLDFGCGNGTLLDYFRAVGWATWGIEPASNAAFNRHGRLEAVPGEPTFDLVIVNHVLEHMPEPLTLLRQCAAAARPDAHLLVAVPRLDTLPHHRDYRYVLNGHAHITAYTWACMQTLLGRAGWTPATEPPTEVGMGSGGRRTSARLRVLARLAPSGSPPIAAPADAARHAIAAFYAERDPRPWLARRGRLRLAALQIRLTHRLGRVRPRKGSRADGPRPIV